jgi:8-oxo-dGTP diphosphatase
MRTATLTVELVAHADAGDRTRWAGDQDDRPLSDLGRRQAARLADALAAGPVDGLYASPARRCKETLAPLATRSGASLTVLPELRETFGFVPPPGWSESATTPPGGPLGGAFAAGRAWTALTRIRAAHPAGRVVVCSHGDLVPALAAFLVGAFGLALPAPHDRRGGWYTLVVAGDLVDAHLRDVLPDFPTA